MRYVTLLVLAVLFLSSIGLASATPYQFYGFTSSGYSTNIDYGQTFNYSGSCNAKISSTNTFTITSPFTSPLAWYSPDSHLIGTSSLSITANTSCKSWGASSTVAVSPASSGLYESSVTWTQSATGGFVTSQTTYSCDANYGYWANFTIGSNDDSRGYCPFKRRTATGSLRSTWLTELQSKYQQCGDLTSWSSASCYISNLGAGGKTAQYIYPFNASGGSFNYIFYRPNPSTFFVEGTKTAYYYIDLLDTVTGTSTNIWSDSFTAPFSQSAVLWQYSVSGSQTLVQDRLYLWVVSFEVQSATGTGGITALRPPNLTMQINTYHPNYICGSYTPCINGSQYRICIDAGGIAPDKTEPQSCFTFPEVSYFLGFDTYSNTKAWYCTQGAGIFIPPITFLGCARDPLLRDRKIPSGWLRGGRYITDTYGNSGWVEDYIDVSESTYYAPDTGGIETSLKMWYLPRKTYLPVWNATGDNRVWCNETTEGQVGSVYKDINNTFWIARNVTALSPYMSLSYRVRSCEAVEIQTTGGFSCWSGCQWFGTCSNIGVCNSTGVDLYTWNSCPETPKASLGVRVKNLDTGTYPLQIVIPNSEIPAFFSSTVGFQEHALNNLIYNNTYEITFAVPPPNGLQEKDAYCVYLDDVNINFRNEPIVCGGSQCYSDYDENGINDYTFVQVTPLSSNSCTIKTTCMDTACVPNALATDVQQILLGRQNYTCDGTTYITINPATKECSYLPDNAICIAQQQQKEAEENATLPNAYLCDLINSSGFDACAVAESAGFTFVASTLFIVFIIDLLIGGYLAYKIKSWEIMPISLIGLMLVETLFGVFPFWFAIIFGIFLALFLAEFIMRRVKGG